MARTRSSVGIPVLLFFYLLPVFQGCGADGGTDAGCKECHRGIEAASPAHPSCVPCHGGDPRKREKEASHRGMFGPKDPSGPQWWDRTCGKCHPYQLARVKSNLMQTNAGMVKNIQSTWEGSDGRLYGTRTEETFDAEGRPLHLEGVTGLFNLSGELYRKFCSLCHIGLESSEVWSGSHAGGCAACHFPFNDNATYEGGDSTVREKWPYSATHRLAALPDNRVCLRCHNRSGRIALSYQGMNDGNNGLVPTAGGRPGPRMIGGARNVTGITPDIHHEKGMECIDCHTSRDVMGDGYAYENMHLQTEIRCEDCHGGASEPPRHAPVTRENEEPVRESRSYGRPVEMGDDLVLTAKGRKYSNVFLSGGKVIVVDKRYGRRHESKVITGTPEHTIAGHGRMECSACHSLSVPQCYGCHTRYDLGEKGRDFIRGADTPGAFSETEDFRMLSPFPLAINQRGKISPVTPGCQTFVTVAAPGGELIKDEYVARYKGKNQLRFAPFYSHNTGRAAIGCSECHADPAFLGFGQHVVQGNRIDALLLCEKSLEKPLDGFLTMKQGKIRAFSAITRENSRPLNAEEIRRVWAVNQCLVCHRNPKDPIYREKIDFRILARCLSRPLPAGR